MLPGIFEATLFSGKRVAMGPKHIRPIHPKSEIAPRRAAVEQILSLGWWGQTKIHGHRAQIHIPSASSLPVVAFNRTGQRHSKELPAAVLSELQRLFRPQQGWNVIDAEWLKAEDRIYVFDFLKREDQLLDSLTYGERYALLPRVYASPCIQTLPPLRTLEACLAMLADPRPEIEGLIFRSPATRGFQDSGIIRCRKRPDTMPE